MNFYDINPYDAESHKFKIEYHETDYHVYTNN